MLGCNRVSQGPRFEKTLMKLNNSILVISLNLLDFLTTLFPKIFNHQQLIQFLILKTWTVTTILNNLFTMECNFFPIDNNFGFITLALTFFPSPRCSSFIDDLEKSINFYSSFYFALFVCNSNTKMFSYHFKLVYENIYIGGHQNYGNAHLISLLVRDGVRKGLRRKKIILIKFSIF